MSVTSQPSTGRPASADAAPESTNPHADPPPVSPADLPVSEPTPQVGTATAIETMRDRLRRLVETHQAAVWRYLRYLGASASEAEDLVQETFLSVGRSGLAIGGEPREATFVEHSPQQTAAYLRTAARRQLLMLRRRQQRQVDTVDLEAAETVWATQVASAAASNGDADSRDWLRDCVEQLEGRPRQAVDLHYRENASRTAIAERLSMTADGVKSLLRRTRQVLRDCIQRKQSQANG